MIALGITDPESERPHDIPSSSSASHQGAGMIFMRFLAFMAGTMVLLAPPLMMADVHTRNMGGWAVLRGLLALAVVAGVFFYVAVQAPRIRRSRTRRVLGAMLLLIPALVGLVALCTRTEPQVLWGSGTMMGLSIMLFIGFVFPVASDSRPMRKRERQEPVIQ
jgi:MFS family permease